MGKILQILIIENRDLAHAQTFCTRVEQEDNGKVTKINKKYVLLTLNMKARLIIKKLPFVLLTVKTKRKKWLVCGSLFRLINNASNVYR